MAIVACVWFALGIRQAHDVSRATSLISSGAVSSDAGYHRALDSLQAASTLNPDREVDILRGEATFEHSDPLAAQRILRAVTRSEPENLEAWLWLAKSAGTDRQLAFNALLRVRALEPVLPTS